MTALPLMDSAERADLLRQTALAGPGYRGLRQEFGVSQKLELAKQLREGGMPIPAFLTQETQWIDRQAKLFEAGDYPDKGVSISEDHLEALVANFDLPVPVLIEHGDSPLHLGFVTSVQKRGTELFGTIALTEEADTLLMKNGAESLSVGLERDLNAIREVSIVRNPRVATARLFGAAPQFDAKFMDVDYEDAMREADKAKRQEEAKKLAIGFLEQGKITPAQRGWAIEILSSDAREAAISFLNALPVNPLLKSITPNRKELENAANNLMLPEEAAFYRKHFPGIDLAEIAGKKNR